MLEMERQEMAKQIIPIWEKVAHLFYMLAKRN